LASRERGDVGVRVVRDPRGLEQHAWRVGRELDRARDQLGAALALRRLEQRPGQDRQLVEAAVAQRVRRVRDPLGRGLPGAVLGLGQRTGGDLQRVGV